LKNILGIIFVKMVSKELKAGIKTELEHAHLFPKNLQKTMAERIARLYPPINHLKEDKNYYTKLKKARL
jgi:hypothetical protein